MRYGGACLDTRTRSRKIFPWTSLIRMGGTKTAKWYLLSGLPHRPGSAADILSFCSGNEVGYDYMATSPSRKRLICISSAPTRLLEAIPLSLRLSRVRVLQLLPKLLPLSLLKNLKPVGSISKAMLDHYVSRPTERSYDVRAHMMFAPLRITHVCLAVIGICLLLVGVIAVVHTGYRRKVGGQASGPLAQE